MVGEAQMAQRVMGARSKGGKGARMGARIRSRDGSKDGSKDGRVVMQRPQGF